MPGDRAPSRRQVLASIGVGTVGAFAGCGCGHGPDYPDWLRVAVEGITAAGAGVQTTYRVTHVGPEQYDGERETFNTSYDEVVLLAYAPDRTRATRVELGNFDPGTERERTVETAAFPLVVTADAASVSTEGECYVAETGGSIRGYRGLFDGEGLDGRTGHVWSELSRRDLGDPLPPRERVFERLKCHQRVDVQVADRPTPDLSLVPGHEAWTGEPLPEPTVREHYEFNTGGPATASQRERFHSPERTVPFERCPDAVKERIRGVRFDQWIDRSRFLDGVSALADRRIDAPSELPGCDRGDVVCHDDRGPSCSSGDAAVDGSLEQYVWYFTRYEGDLYPVVPCYTQRWLPPGEPETLPSCSDRRREAFGAYVLQGLEHAHERRAATVPGWIRDLIGEATHGQTRVDVGRERWLQAFRTMQGRPGAALPTCELQNVVCHVDRSVHCGSGRREAIFWAEIDGQRWGIQLEYEWRRLPEDET